MSTQMKTTTRGSERDGDDDDDDDVGSEGRFCQRRVRVESQIEGENESYLRAKMTRRRSLSLCSIAIRVLSKRLSLVSLGCMMATPSPSFKMSSKMLVVKKS